MNPPVRCPHRVRVTEIRVKDGWCTPIAPTGCEKCEQGQSCGLPWLEDPGTRPPRPVQEPGIVHCEKTLGCVLVFRQGEAHTAPCLVLDTPRPTKRKKAKKRAKKKAKKRRKKR